MAPGLETLEAGQRQLAGADAGEPVGSSRFCALMVMDEDVSLPEPRRAPLQCINKSMAKSVKACAAPTSRMGRLHGIAFLLQRQEC